MMRRVHIHIDDWQLTALKRRAERQRMSLSALVRQCIVGQLRQWAATGYEHLAIAGIGENPDAHGRDHDQYPA